MTQLSFNVIVGLLLRGVALMAAGWLASRGILPAGTSEEWAGAVALAACAYLWSWGQKRAALRHQDALVKTALQLPPTATIEDVHAALIEGPTGNDPRAIV